MTKDSGTTKHLIGDSVLGSAVGQQFPVSSTPPVFLPTCREAAAVSDATDKLLCSTTAQSNRAACEGHLTTSAADAPATRACVWNAWTAQTCHDANAYRIVDGLNQYYYDPQQVRKTPSWPMGANFSLSELPTCGYPYEGVPRYVLHANINMSNIDSIGKTVLHE